MKHSKLIYAVVLALAPQFCVAQQQAFTSPVEDPSSVAAASIAESAVASVTAIKPELEKPVLGRWLDLYTLSHSERYRSAFEIGGTHVFNGGQQRSLIEGKFKLDAKGRYDIGFRASSGRYFNWAFGGYTGSSFIPNANAGGPTYFSASQAVEFQRAAVVDPTGLSVATSQVQSNGWEFYMRELYFSATPVKPVTLEFGSFAIERGYSSEITTFDEDGYISGERIRFHDSKHLFFDEVAFTNAYFGDLGTVNLFDRGSSLKQFNDRQLSAKKKLNSHVAFSGEYTRQTGIDTLREAFVVRTKQFKVVDSVHMEAYERLNSITFAGLAQSPLGPIPALMVKGASGFAVTAAKSVNKLSGDIGFATIDSDYSVYANSRVFHGGGFPLNGDAYGQGNRVFTHASYKIAPGFTAFGYFTHEVGGTRVLTLNQQGLTAGMNFDLKAMINKEKLVF
jgi:hypothetical protein